jgi:2-phosphosulfolactate phosphatase
MAPDASISPPAGIPADMIIDPRVQVLARKEDIDPARLAGRVFIVLDILFATSTIVTALAHGARSVLTAPDGATARILARDRPAGSFVLAGEHLAQTIDRFAPPTPLALLEHELAGRDLIYSTTNGTVALAALAGAADVYAASLLNGRATVAHVLERHAGQRIVVVCSGSVGHFNLEDWHGAGHLVDLIVKASAASADLSDAARAARRGYLASSALAALLEGRVGRMFSARGLSHEIEYASRCDLHDIVVRREGDALVRVGPTG